MNYAEIEQELIEMGYDVCEANYKRVVFWYKDNLITFWIKKQWASGKGVQDGRGIENLFKQIKPKTECCPTCGRKY